MSSVTSPPASAKSHAFAGVFTLLGAHLTELDRFLHAQLGAFEPEIRNMVDYCIDTSGKRIRPALVFLSGWRVEGGTGVPPGGSETTESGAGRPGHISPDLVRVAAVVELVHLATLVHDDIMAEA